MWPLIEASILTSAIYTVGMFTKKKLTSFSYAILFIVFFIIALIFGSTLHAEVPNAKMVNYDN